MKLLMLLMTSALLAGKPYQEVEDQNTLTILNPALSQRETAKLRLDNGIEAYLISDPDIDISAAAVSIETGQWSDPKEYPGMAHFLEHMLFLGTEKYPEEKGFFTYVADHGGSFNAYTSTDRTVYMFTVTNDALDEGLDRFAHFFIDPLFSPSGIGRELLAVDQENDKNIENDGWRNWMIFKETGNQAHPNASFSTGNADTLGGIPQKALKKWFQQHYSAENMHLVIYTSVPMAELKKLVVTSFAETPARDVHTEKPHFSLTSEQQKGHMTYVKPIKDLRSLSLSWELPEYFATDADGKSAELVAYALSSQHENSLASQLKKEGLAEAQTASTDRFSKETLLLSINIQLTEEGVKKHDQVIDRCFQMIATLKENGVPKYLFDEMQTMVKIHYEYQSKGDAFQTVAKHAHALIDEDLETYPKKTLLPIKYQPQAIQELISDLTPGACLYSLNASPELTGVPVENTEKWLGGEYTIKRISSDKLQRWKTIKSHSQMTLQPQNPFLPQNLTLLRNQKTFEGVPTPLRISDDENGIAYFSQDEQYLVPEIDWTFMIKSPLLDGSAKSHAFTTMTMYTIEEKLMPYLSFAQDAGLSGHLVSSDFRLGLHLQGLNEKAPTLLQVMLHGLKTSTPTREQFKIYKASLLSYFQSQNKAPPYAQANEFLSNILYNNAPLSSEIAQELDDMHYEEFITFQNNLFKEAYVEGMMIGNMTEHDAKATWFNLIESLGAKPYPKEEQFQKEILLLPKAEGPFMVTEHSKMQGNAAILFIEEGTFTFEKKAAQSLLAAVLSQEFFTELRTKQQTAYIAKTWADEEALELSQFFLVQSTTHSAEELLPRFELFIEDFLKNFETRFPQERFENVKQSLITKLSTPQPNLNDLAALLNKLAFKYDDLKRINKLIAAFEKITYDELKQNAITFLSRKNSRRLALLLEGVSPEDKNFRYAKITAENLRSLTTHQ